MIEAGMFEYPGEVRSVEDVFYELLQPFSVSFLANCVGF